MISGDHTIHCAESGVWIGVLPVCESECYDYHSSLNNLSRMAPYECGLEESYRNRLATVLPTLSEVYCGHPPNMTNGHYSGSYYFGDFVVYSCDEGCELIGGDAVLQCGENGTYIGRTPRCLGMP